MTCAMAFTDTAENRPQQANPGGGWVGGASAAVRDYVQEARDRWLFRRILLFAVVFFFCAGILISAVNGNENIGNALVWGVVALVSFYIGAPIADDFLQTRPGARAA